MALNATTSGQSVLKHPHSVGHSISFSRMPARLSTRHIRKDFYLFLGSVFTAEVVTAIILLTVGSYYFMASNEKCSRGNDHSVYWVLPMASIGSSITAVGAFGYNCWAFFHRPRRVWIAVYMTICLCIIFMVTMIAVIVASFCRGKYHRIAEIVSSIGALVFFMSGIHLVLVYHPNSKFARTNRCGGALNFPSASRI